MKRGDGGDEKGDGGDGRGAGGKMKRRKFRFRVLVVELGGLLEGCYDDRGDGGGGTR